MNKNSRAFRWLAASVPYQWLFIALMHLVAVAGQFIRSGTWDFIGIGLAVGCGLLGAALLAERKLQPTAQPEVHP